MSFLGKVLFDKLLGWNTPEADPLRRRLGSYRNYVTISGRIVGERYVAPRGLFSCAVPALLQPGAVITDKYAGKDGGVVFSDDTGRQYRVEVIELTDATLSRLSPYERSDRLLAQRVLALPRSAQVTRRKHLDEPGEGLYAEMMLPGGMPVITVGERGVQMQHTPLTQGLVIFTRGELAVQVMARAAADPLLSVLSGGQDYSTGDPSAHLEAETVALARSVQLGVSPALGQS